jgi:hypothetical protein
MGAMKRFYTASREYDRETGASLCPRLEWWQRDMLGPERTRLEINAAGKDREVPTSSPDQPGKGVRR